MMLYRY